MRLLTTVLTLAACLAFSVAGVEGQRGSRSGRGRTSPPRAQPTLESGQGIDLSRQGFAVMAVSPHSWSTVVVQTLALPGGSAADAQLSGSAWLLGETVRAALARRLGPSGTTVLVRVTRDQTIFQLVTPPGRWQGAYEAMLEEVFTTPLDTQELQRIRVAQRDLFRFESGAPVRAFQGELYALLVGSGNGWNHDPRGSAETLDRITVNELNDFRRRVYRREQAVVTLVGALDREAGPYVYRAPQRGDGGRRGGAAWSSGRRQRSVKEVTNIWIGAAFPARRDTPRTVLEYLLLRLEDELNPVPRDPGLYGASVRLEDLPDGPALIVEAAVLPEDLRRWEERIDRALIGLQGRYDDDAFFELHKREFKNAALTRDAAPEAEGLRMAMDLIRDGTLRDLPAEIDELSAEQVLRAMDSLGQPRILVFGPDLGGR